MEPGSCFGHTWRGREVGRMPGNRSKNTTKHLSVYPKCLAFDLTVLIYFNVFESTKLEMSRQKTTEKN